ncbi:MAG: ADP-dependent glucokinase/phosphofructokinase [Methanothrix soehngenii]|uniref:ADP-dependent glucokinase/phosphofructokinase n=1 Tax=Methanothrix soehngenii TaxID=2223 RepID=UPI0023F43020|nr:ADP-dependent glucokinase/phosphofructokinase [Methanothrix soehngenii]MDD5257133.1 ADP-dependent glucokinase/phosphofructokinase [Methanothrix soehngenii]
MKIICAYPVNLDALYDLGEERISRFIQSADPSGIKSEMKGSIRSREDLISSLLYCMQQGSGAEILVESLQLAEEIEASFPWSFRLGGNAGIMANLLAELGARPILNAPALEPRLAALLHPGVGIPVSGRLMEPSLAAERLGLSSEVLHFVFQFKESDRIPSPQGPISAARDNRFIATYDPVNTRMVSNQDFDAYCQDHIQEIEGAILSGFHLAPLDRYREIFPPRIEQIRSWKEANPNIYIHVEMGSFQSQKIARHFLRLLEKADSLGLNEDELETATAEYSAIGSSPVSSTALSTARPKMSQWQERMQKAAGLREHLGIFRISVHTRDYILSIMEEGKITAKDELLSLQKGADAAAALAATGSAKGMPPVEVNPRGLEAKREFCRQGAEAAGVGRGAFHKRDGLVVSLMPSLLAREPRITVGLGDTATAATFNQELQAIKKSRI